MGIDTTVRSIQNRTGTGRQLGWHGLTNQVLRRYRSCYGCNAEGCALIENLLVGLLSSMQARHLVLRSTAFGLGH